MSGELSNKWHHVPYTGLGGGNSLLECDGFNISYNPNPGSAFSMFASDDGGAETAICIPRGDGTRKYLILNGDFRSEYEKLAQNGLKACVEFFKNKREEHGSSWTSHDWDSDSSLIEATS